MSTARKVMSFLPILIVFVAGCPQEAGVLPDDNLEAVVRYELDIAPGIEILKEDLDQLHWLEGDNRQIRNLKGLELCTGLWFVYLRNNQISDIGPLVQNPGLDAYTEIYLTGNPLSRKALEQDAPALRARGILVVVDDDPPVASFATDVTLDGCGMLAVQFTDTSEPSGSIKSWAWDFGDGQQSNLQNPAHVYFGLMLISHVALTVESDSGESTCMLPVSFGWESRDLRIFDGLVGKWSCIETGPSGEEDVTFEFTAENKVTIEYDDGVLIKGYYEPTGGEVPNQINTWINYFDMGYGDELDGTYCILDLFFIQGGILTMATDGSDRHRPASFQAAKYITTGTRKD